MKKLVLCTFVALLLLSVFAGCAKHKKANTTVVVTLSGQPTGTVSYHTADIIVAGTDVVSYKYKLDNDTWSTETPVSTYIILSNLADGLHTISVVGKDAAGHWQADTSSTTTSWTVNTTNLVIPSTTEILDNATLQELSSISSDTSTLMFSGTTAQLQTLSAGDIIVFGVTELTPYGLIRKVSTISAVGNQVELKTTQATLEDAIESGTIEVNKTLTPQDISSTAQPTGNGPTLTAAPQGFYVAMKDVVLYDKDGNKETTYDQITANGDISFNPSFNFNMTIDNFQLKQLTFTTTITEEAHIEVASGVSAPLIHEKVQVGNPYYFNPIIVWIPAAPLPLPIVIVPKLALKVGIDGDVSASIKCDATQTATLTAGLSYSNGQWTPINNFDNDFPVFAQPSISAGASLKAYAGPQLGLLVAGIVGPTAAVYGSLGLDADMFSTPWWTLYGGLQADVGVKFEVLSHVVVDYQAKVIDFKKVLAQAETQTTLPAATLSGQPTGTVDYSTANIIVAGSNVVSYKYKLDSGSWSTETSVSIHIILSNLADGLHTISVVGKDAAGNWQVDTSSITTSWTVITSTLSTKVVFPDAKLEAYIREAIGKSQGDIYQADLVGLTSFSIGSMMQRGVTDLTGLEHCTSLTLLNLRYNQISNLSPLSSLINLTHLDLLGNLKISDLSPLSSLTSLTLLYLDNNQISDISPLSSLTSLSTLWLYNNQISNISPLSSLTSLTWLDLGSNQISNISPLSSLTSLTGLGLYSNQISNISPLSSLTSLTWLDLGSNQISNISPLSSLTSLTGLHLENNQISDIEPLVKNSGLGQGDNIYLTNNPLSTTSVNTYIPALKARGVMISY